MRLGRYAHIVMLGVWLAVGQSARASGNFTITIQPEAGLAANPDALAAFNRAANEWSSQITSAFPVNIVIDAGMVNLGASNVIGQTSFTGSNAVLNQPYDRVRNAMAARAGRPGDAILASLPTQAQVAAHVPGSFVANNQPINYTFDTQHIGTLRANQKVLGLLGPSDPSYNTPDGIIQFNSNFNFSYSAQTLNPFKMDFQTVAAHEIGHVLGFTSDVDDFDSAITSGQSLSDDLTTLDMFRFNANELPTAANFATAPRELRPGQASFTDDLTHQYAMSTGAFNGDSHQASHWQDDEDFTGSGQLIGIMDPTLNFGTIESVEASDLRDGTDRLRHRPRTGLPGTGWICWHRDADAASESRRADDLKTPPRPFLILIPQSFQIRKKSGICLVHASRICDPHTCGLRRGQRKAHRHAMIVVGGDRRRAGLARAGRSSDHLLRCEFPPRAFAVCRQGGNAIGFLHAQRVQAADRGLFLCKKGRDGERLCRVRHRAEVDVDPLEISVPVTVI